MKHVSDRQVKLEEAMGARENPAINEIQSDEGQWTRRDEKSNSYWSEESNLLTKKHVKKSQTQFHFLLVRLFIIRHFFSVSFIFHVLKKTPCPSRRGGATWGRHRSTRVSVSCFIYELRPSSLNYTQVSFLFTTKQISFLFHFLCCLWSDSAVRVARSDSFQATSIKTKS